ncbi:MAG: hypothetical protein FVQ85_16005 [Planctomycetes bacterium]|nr:hypothetical protein [Planctomycetota bacterium]
MKSKRKFVGAVLVIGVVFGLAGASEAELIRLKVSAKVDCVDVPVHTVIDLPASFANVPVDEIVVSIRQASRGMAMPGQIVKGSDKKVQLWWVMPRAKAGSTNRWTATLKRREKADKETFSWKDKEGEYLDLLFGGRKKTRYMYAYDTSTPQRVFETYKPLHHVFDAQGKHLLTNGPDGEHPYTKGIKFPHHRGIFIGWNRLEFGGQRFDLWHMPGVAQVHQKFLEMAAGPVMARSKSLVHWNDKGGEAMIAEQRQVTVFGQSEPTVLLLEFQSELKAVKGDVFLNGDPEHAGVQYRAHNDVATGGKEVKATYLFHKDGIDAHRDKDLPWAAMSCGLNGRRYSVQHMNHPDNPKQTLYSAYRDYGRFGAFFKKKIGAGETLTLRYRILVAESEMPERGELAKKYSEFVDGPKVEVVEP